MNSDRNQRPTWAEISLTSLKHNYRIVKQRLKPGTSLMAVVKADAYGHGAVECARALEADGADWFGVALIEEGIELRRAGIRKPIFCMGGFWTGQADDVISNNLTPAIFRIEAVQELDQRASQSGRLIGYHLKVDTGMGRLGVPFDELQPFISQLRRFNNLKLEGVLTHFAEADSNEDTFTRMQISTYNEAVEMLRQSGYLPQWRHLANSAGIHAYPQSHGNLARAGATMYGLTRDVLAPRSDASELEPVMSVFSTVVMLKKVPAGKSLGYGRTFIAERESLIATLPIGYADGLRRGLSNNGEVIIRNRPAPIVGRVSMDLTIIDVTDISHVSIGDRAIVIGSSPDFSIHAEDQAERLDTISYEVITGISPRVPRVYRS